MNRLLKANFKQYSGGSWNHSDMDYTSWMGATGEDDRTAYDLNGNIKRMVHKGFKVGTPDALIDDLQYEYFANTNKLKKVTDLVVANNNLGDFYDQHQGGDDYGYDVNGNMITDRNKRLLGNVLAPYGTGIDVSSFNQGSIHYNHMNLPQSILVRPGVNGA
ncbi:MAG: hypothetical protein H7Y86_09085, partial [Rhizobacter sp.]|nr:hypothetical protein [Ferruginibacter sp.]